MADKANNEVTEDVGGVQGSGADEVRPETEDVPPQISSNTPDQPAPDAGEIEWAGGLVKKPPAPQN